MKLPVQPGTIIRLDALGGIAGDMFVAAAVATWPGLADQLRSAVAALNIPFACDLGWNRVSRGGLEAQHFSVGLNGHESHPTGLVSEIKEFISASALPGSVRQVATDLFDVIAEAEGKIHGVPPDQVHLHELADWDSIIDMVSAAIIIDAVGPAKWVCPVLPLGSGTVRCAHGTLPVPAPAVEILCRGARMVADAVSGERVTPTGAAILAYLRAFDDPGRVQGRLVVSGYGAGSKDFAEVPNVLRLLVLEPDEGLPDALQRDQVAVLRFDIDDQTPEDLAISLDRLRQLPGVLSITSAMLAGKKGRLSFGVEILADPIHSTELATACLEETTTLGVRTRTEDRLILERWQASIETKLGGAAPVKLARRPAGALTAKLEADYMATVDAPSSQRAMIRAELENQAIEQHVDRQK